MARATAIVRRAAAVVARGLRRRIADPLLPLLQQGKSADRLALAVAVGVVVGNIPIFGTSTILCAVVALAFRLNQPAIQIAQASMAPIFRRTAAEGFGKNQAEQP